MQAQLFDVPQAAPTTVPAAAPRPQPAAQDTATAEPAGACDLLVVDGNSLAHRAYHAYAGSQMTTRDGTAIWAVYGFFALLIGIIDKTAPGHVLLAFDSATSFRRARYADYKAGRSEKDAELVAQLARIPELARTLGLATVVVDDHEADDVVASAAAAATDRGWTTTIATSDRDAFGLVTDTVTVLRLVSGLDNAVTVTPAWLEATYGVPAGRYLEFAAMRGDKSDNLPGVAGVGEKTAAKILAVTGDVADIYTDPDAYRAELKGAVTKLLADRANYDRNIELMAMVTTLAVDLDACALPADSEAVAAALVTAELPNLAGRADKLCSARADASRIDAIADAYGDYSDVTWDADPFAVDADPADYGMVPDDVSVLLGDPDPDPVF